ncbi:hypothetical protein CLAFUW4_04544 [Fulvia fulva]|uniref:Uncharacterized protein n=1 Tax=Passalora fulva TaxID=5499 RepID=A0A9Q8LEM6_PASFU|nr:uncharacterized protein CLAFUR5_04507 [Fulvia fulva]KAK4626496.1 hypothetical protein CLAFUR4_04530 [Fulvia fulva]UJO16016.1 hypothetical protein CLAFUR5_04507 [Fulvia fulva]WPV13115.1 hypothetical protein CLAFUW4_04544 [Fulvia fulva]WPV28161.1 hypothetical protein CLAFUW7_04536 [Fulvia fulva]
MATSSSASAYHSHHSHSHSHSRAETPVSPLVSDFPLPGHSNHHTPSSSNAYSRFNSNVHDLSPLSGTPPIMSPSPSISSYSNSTWTSQLPLNIATVHPPPAYVAQFGAAQVVSDRKRRFSDDEDDDVRTTISSMRDDVQFSQPALILANAFLDQLLYSFLANARSTTLTALRPAVIEVLKSRLATEAIASAEEELQELLAGGDDEEEEMNHRQTLAERQRKWDTELVWKRTRLRVMVYIRLGEMEDDDEERYVRENELFQGADRRFSQSSGLVSWAAAIFLTSVLEYVAEQTLQVAAQAADSRARRQCRNPRAPTSAFGMVSPVDGVTVEDYDMEKVALNSGLGRLWRTWRKSLRSNANGAPLSPATTSSNNFSRRLSRDIFGPGLNPRSSFGTGPDALSVMEDSRRPSLMTTDKDVTQVAEDGVEELPEAGYPEHVLAANIPLPIGDEVRDVDEIEVPGLARDPDVPEIDHESMAVAALPKRRNSFSSHANFMLMDKPVRDTTATLETPETKLPDVGASKKPILTRKRSASVPMRIPGAFPVFEEPIAEEAVEHSEATEPVSEDAVKADPKPEQKANAVEMAIHKRKASQSPDAKSLEDKVVQEDPVSEVTDAKDTHKGVLGLAAAGSAAAAAAALSAVYGASPNKKTKRQSMPPVETDIEQREQQKKRNNMKRLSVPVAVRTLSWQKVQDQDEPQTARRVSLSSPNTPPTIVQTHSSSTVTSPIQETLDDDRSSEKTSQQASATPRYIASGAGPDQESSKEEPVDIGVARTSDTAVASPKPDDSSEEFRYARDRDSYTNPNPRRPSRLFIGTQPVEAVPTKTDNPPAQAQKTEDLPVTSPEAFLSKRSLAVSPKVKEAAEKAKEQTPTHDLPDGDVKPTTHAITTGKSGSSPQPSPGVEKIPEKSENWVPHSKKSASVSEAAAPPASVQPAVPKMTVVKKKEAPFKEEAVVSLTSASIKGPEDFEMFVQGGDTVKYTLTPENVRDDPSPIDAVPIRKAARNHERSTSAPRKQSPSAETRTGRSQSSKHITSASPLPPDTDDDHRPRKDSDKRRSISRPPVRNVSAHRRSGLMAREPQVLTESTRDFADFIRSTGPSKEQEVMPILNNRSTTSLHSLLNGSRSSSPGAASARSLNRSTFSKDPIPPLPAMPSKGKGNMQARGATTNADGSTSELIDFIRSGPSSNGQGDRQHRISRTVAPFRTTMDSDQADEWGERLVAQPDLKLTNTTQSAPSLKSASSVKSSHKTSANSRAPLLSQTTTNENVQPTHNGVPPRLSSMPKQAEGGAPAPKRYRNKDPYAIDFDDDDEDDDLLKALPKNARVREEESLIDFLRNSEPPASHTPRTASAPAGRRQGSTSGIKNFSSDAVSLDRSGSASSRDGGRPAKQACTYTVGNAPAPPRSGGTTSVAIGGLGKPPPPKMQARGFGKQQDDGGMQDLADSLRSSGPSTPTQPTPIATKLNQTSSRTSVRTDTSKKSRRSSFFGLFSKKSNSQQAQYLDM